MLSDECVPDEALELEFELVTRLEFEAASDNRADDVLDKDDDDDVDLSFLSDLGIDTPPTK